MGVVMAGDFLKASMFLAVVIVLPVVSPAQQSSSLEQRLADLERRVAKIEARAGISGASETVQKSNSAVEQPSYSATSAYSAAVPVSLKLINKKIAHGEGNEPDGIQFHIQFKNTGMRDITGIDGDLFIKNLSAKPLMDFGMSMSKYIAAGDSLLWPCEVEYDPSEDGQKAVYQSDKSYLIVDLKPQKIQYSDGTVDVMGK
jgi:hypothetical protein